MIKITNAILLHCSISNRNNEIATDVVFRMVVVDGAIVAPPHAKDPKNNATPLTIATVFVTPPPTKDPEDDVAPLLACVLFPSFETSNHNPSFFNKCFIRNFHKLYNSKYSTIVT